MVRTEFLIFMFGAITIGALWSIYDQLSRMQRQLMETRVLVEYLIVRDHSPQQGPPAPLDPKALPDWLRKLG